ncbi:MaoC family dehydratase [Kordiimonas sp. SCSIO 12610]|uniref:MaoC family dehydratase n=1 Tax=Kordiimonas sp. SCSIO 12610 TaxID=2829597 RepID=UPI00210DBB02|nr:MaoC family dehydratase [Kordiimonas sp. SCSIO 12610]UTW55796.1 MaoC family dehydratase [Kordiimonas sp. SCSIO 12610]
MFKIFYEDINIGDTETFGAYAVTKEEILDFAEKYDPQPFHLDEEIAKQSVFGKLCASGWHTCAMTMRMMVDQLSKQGLASMGSPGIDELKWRKPVFPGDILSVKTTVAEKRPSESRPEIGLLKADYEVSNQRGEIVMTMKGNYMVAKRSA